MKSTDSNDDEMVMAATKTASDKAAHAADVSLLDDVEISFGEWTDGGASSADDISEGGKNPTATVVVRGAGYSTTAATAVGAPSNGSKQRKHKNKPKSNSHVPAAAPSGSTGGTTKRNTSGNGTTTSADTKPSSDAPPGFCGPPGFETA
jgi:hypothetical protein